MDTIELFNGGVRFNKYLILVDFILIIHFIYDWYLIYKKTGRTLDYWTLTMSLTYFLPFLIMYPFASSVYNVVSVGGNVSIIQDVIDTAYIIFMIGYISMYLGRYLYIRNRTNTAIYKVLINPVKQTLTKSFITAVKSSLISRILCILYFIGLLAILASGLGDGSSDIRAVFQANPAIRAIYNFVLILSSIVSLILIARVFQYRYFIDKVLLFLFFIITLFIGARAFLAQPLIYLFGFYVFYNKMGKINLIKIGIIGFSGLFLGMGLSLFRSGDLSLKGALSGFGEQIFYGNSYSDLRDFAWVYAYWDKSLLFGKTYLAAFMSFIPSYFSDYRTQWAAGKFTAVTVGFDPIIHPGLRPGIFGESFFNFGYLGVVFLGTILGYAYKFIDDSIKISSKIPNKVFGISSIVSTLFIANLTITSGFFALYVFLVVLVLVKLFSKALKLFSR
ncbi:O-antigen polymerase [Pedobacter sp. MR22-3]|uniref:O-antigen polymerase n=1 Tax=Pedobacter sp. MR22-3 TaxID=2994552 RepID=UPI0022473981|nr:O-antigen polymerase [Pedobacter sp. MR22-3]MCX2582899.1 O-antigen ligase [Pedobacter sp. MR22-3]